MQKLSTFDDVLALWETPKALSDDLGVPYVNAQSMKNRRSIAVDHWTRLLELLEKRGYALTIGDLVAMRRRRKAERAAELKLASTQGAA